MTTFIFMILMSVFIVTLRVNKILRDIVIENNLRDLLLVIVSFVRVILFFVIFFIMAKNVGCRLGAVIILASVFGYAVTFLVNIIECHKFDMLMIW